MSHLNFGTAISIYKEKEGQFEQPLHHCANPSCTGSLWTVEKVSARDQLWRVRSATDGSYLIAGVTPACPWCGGDLTVAATLDELPGEQVESETQWN